MKIASFLGALNRGGTETLILDLLSHSKIAPYDIICLYRKDGDLSNDYLNSNVLIKKIEIKNKINFVGFLKNVRKTLINEKTDIIHTHQRIDTIIVWLASIGLQIKIIQTFHEFDYNVTALDKFLILFSFKITDGNLFVSNFLKNHYCSKYKLKLDTINDTIYNGIDLDKFNLSKLHHNQLELEVPKGCLKLGTVGNFVMGHDPITICRFLYLLLRKGVDFRFFFIGKKDNNNPQIYNECVEFCHSNAMDKNVIFLGSRPDVPFILSQLDAFIYSSDHDTFGISVIEALITGLPVFVNDWEVMKEITEEGERAIIYKSKDEHDLLDKFIEFYQEPEIFKEEAAKNLFWAREKYDINKHILQLNDIYYRLIKLDLT